MTAIPAAARPFRLGVHLTEGGADVAVFASHATAVELCLIKPASKGVAPGGWRERRIALLGPEYGVWHGHVAGVTAGQLYGFRAYGPWDPDFGLRHNPAKLLVDPYARAVVGELRYDAEVFGQVVADQTPAPPSATQTPDAGAPAAPIADAPAPPAPTGPSCPADPRDSINHVPHSVVVDDHFDGWSAPRPNVPWSETVIYEAHVRGLTKQLPGISEELRGTYAGLASDVMIEHLSSLGVTTLELLPVHAFTPEEPLVQRGLTNYWGYNTLGFFAPHHAYASAAAQAAGPQAVLAEFKGMVERLHAAGLEVILDVVYNHTCESGADGPHLSFKGLDNTVYYRHDGAMPAAYADVTGCGNALDFRRARVVQLALDSLRYWVQEMGVDGFRFDLAVTLARGHNGFDPGHPFLVALQTDPVLAGVKLIAEPWDLGPGGWQTGGFPPPMAEWNDRFRDAVRAFWLADPGQAAHGAAGRGVSDLATRLAGSADLFGHSDPPLMRGPMASINFVTAHDGFTMADLVTYDFKHNEANGEGNRDGTDNNLSWSHGIEGPIAPDSPGDEISHVRRRSIRNLMASLVLAAGTPMIAAGDEIARTQQGNNNAYCQDGELSWVNWDAAPWRDDLFATMKHLLALRRAHPAIHSARFFDGRPLRGAGRQDLSWWNADGSPLVDGQWRDPAVRTVQMLRSDPTTTSPGVLMVINGALDQVDVTLPDDRATAWELAWDSVWENPSECAGAEAEGELHGKPGDKVPMDPLSVRVYVSR